jgi:hypothetical protein
MFEAQTTDELSEKERIKGQTVLKVDAKDERGD